MTFFVVVSPFPLDPDRVIVVSLQVTTFLDNEFEKAYCARISSPSFGTIRNGGSTLSINNPCDIEFTTAAISASKGSFGFVHTNG
jgi:hypothetical protein